MPRRSVLGRDGAVIGAVVVLSLVWYLPRLGFYSDDWAFLGMYATSTDQSIRGLYHASFSPQHAMRPVQLWLCAALYRCFGMEPLGYHLVNALLLVVNPLLVYAIAHELRLRRNIALPVALIYGVLPNYSTDRYWYVAFAITLSMTAALASLYLAARGARGPRVGWSAWGASMALLLVSALAYEVALPLLLIGVPAVVGWRLWQRREAITRQSIVPAAAMLAIALALLAGAAFYKVRTTVRLGAEQGVAAQIRAITRQAVRTDLPRGEYGLNVFNAVRVHFGEYGVQLVPNAVALARTASVGVVVLTLLAAVITFIYLLAALRTEPWPPLSEWVLLSGAGLAVFAIGYAIFLTNYNVQFTPTGIANRSAIAAALGAAMCLAGGAGLVASAIRVALARSLAFAAAVSMIAGSGVLIVNVVAADWIAAFEAEQRVLAGIRDRFAVMPAGTTILLEGVCPYIGPAIVFEANWDLTGALQVSYRERALAANIVTPRMTADEAGITSRIYGQPTQYRYSSSLLAFDAGSGRVQPLADAATARAWLSRSLAARRCPAGQEGLGVEPF